MLHEGGEEDHNPARSDILPGITCTSSANYLYHHEKAEEFDTNQNHRAYPEKEIYLTNLPEKEFKIEVITMLTELQRNMQELRDDIQREITEVKQSLEGFISRMDRMQEATDGIETREQEHIEADAEREKRISRNERILRELCDQSKRNNVGVPEEREKGIECVFGEIIAENFPKLGERIIDQTMEVHRTPNRRDPRRKTPRHITIKMTKIKDKHRVLKAVRERKKVTYKGKPSGYHQTSQQKPYRPEGRGMIYLMQ